jgi:hypothetical protein
LKRDFFVVRARGVYWKKSELNLGDQLVPMVPKTGLNFYKSFELLCTSKNKNSRAAAVFATD